MAGKKGQKSGTNKPKPGAGRPPKPKPDYSDAFRDRFENIVTRLKKKHGKDILEAALEMMYDGDVQDTVKVSILKAYMEMNTVKRSEKKIETTEHKPLVRLPPLEPDPALEVIDGGKK